LFVVRRYEDGGGAFRRIEAVEIERGDSDISSREGYKEDLEKIGGSGVFIDDTASDGYEYASESIADPTDTSSQKELPIESIWHPMVL
jgi:hypothetical protein